MTSTDTRHAYAPLFDDSDIAALAGRRVCPYVGVLSSTIFRAETGDRRFHPLSDIAARLIHDRQFVDLSERYDPIEATVDANLEPCRLTMTEHLLIATSFASAAAMALAACLS